MKSATAIKGLVVVVLVIAVLVGAGFTKGVLWGEKPQALAVGGEPSGGVQISTATEAGGIDAGCNTNPTVTYVANDVFTAYQLGGTANIKEGDQFPVATLANPEVGKKVKYWLNNASWFVVPAESEIKCGTKTIYAKAYQNNTQIDIALEDSLANVVLDEVASLELSNATANNVTIGANAVKNLKVSWTGTKWRSSMPQGGCLLVDIPSNVTQVVASGEGLKSGCKYTNTYSTLATTNTYKAFEIPNGWDADGTANTKSFNLQLTSGTNNPRGYGRLIFIPADIYVSNLDGEFKLDTELVENDDSTQTFGTVRSFIFAIN